MGDVFGTIFDVKLFYTDACLEKTDEPQRLYKRRRWQTDAQAARKAKKWAKRWGYVMRPCMFKTPLGLFAHPSMRPLIEQAIAKEHTIRQYTDPAYGLRNGLFSAASCAV